MSDAISGLMVLGSIRKLVEQAMGSKPVSSIPPWLLHQLLPPGSYPVPVQALTAFEDKLFHINVSKIALSSSSCFGQGILSHSWLRRK